MRASFILLILSAITILSCKDEEVLQHGTIIKSIAMELNGVTVPSLDYKYDESGNLIEIRSAVGNSFGSNYSITYADGKVQKVNQEVLVYENNVLTKTLYTNNDTSYVVSEFEFQNGRMIAKTIYLRSAWRGPWWPSSHEVTDTVHLQFQYDDAGNINQTIKGEPPVIIGEPPIVIWIRLPDLNSIHAQGSYEYDTKKSPFADFPLELKCYLLINPGPNNVVRKSASPAVANYSLQYNLDGYPISSSAANPYKGKAIIEYH